MDLLGRETDVGADGNSGVDKRGDNRGTLGAALQLHGLRAGILYDTHRGLQRLGRAGLISAERQVNHHEGAGGGRDHRAGQWNDLIEGERQRGLAAQHHIGQGIPHEQQIYAGFIKNPGGHAVIASHAGKSLGFPLGAGKMTGSKT